MGARELILYQSTTLRQLMVRQVRGRNEIGQRARGKTWEGDGGREAWGGGDRVSGEYLRSVCPPRT